MCAIELFIIFLYYPCNVYGICNDIPLSGDGRLLVPEAGNSDLEK